MATIRFAPKMASNSSLITEMKLFGFLLDELASDEDEINEDDVQYIEGLAQKVWRVFIVK